MNCLDMFRKWLKRDCRCCCVFVSRMFAESAGLQPTSGLVCRNPTSELYTGRNECPKLNANQNITYNNKHHIVLVKKGLASPHLEYCTQTLKLNQQIQRIYVDHLKAGRHRTFNIVTRCMHDIEP